MCAHWSTAPERAPPPPSLLQTQQATIHLFSWLPCNTCPGSVLSLLLSLALRCSTFISSQRQRQDQRQCLRGHTHTRECVQVEMRKERDNKTIPEDMATTTMLWKEEETPSHRAAHFLGIRNKFSATLGGTAYNTRTAGKLSQTCAMTRLYLRSQSK